jgi:hypothetical protein
VLEQVFAKLKHRLRTAEPRDAEAIWRKVGELLDIFSTEECANYLKNSGYVSVYKHRALAYVYFEGEPGRGEWPLPTIGLRSGL